MNKSIYNEDLYAGLGAIISAIFSALSWLWNIPPLQFLFTFILGSLVTYFVQSKLQDRAEKRKITREIIEKIYGPLYIELQEIKEYLIDTLYKKYGTKLLVPESSAWEKTKTYPEFFSIPLKLRDEMEVLIKKAKDLDNSLFEIKGKINSILVEIGTSVFKPYYEHVGTRISPKPGYESYPSINYKSMIGRTLYHTLLVDSIILDRNPLDELKQRFSDFDPQRCQLSIVVEEDRPHQSPQDHPIDIPFIQVQEDLNKYLETAKQRITQEKEVLEFLEERSELSERVNKLLPVIKRHIERHYPIEKM